MGSRKYPKPNNVAEEISEKATGGQSAALALPSVQTVYVDAQRGFVIKVEVIVAPSSTTDASSLATAGNTTSAFMLRDTDSDLPYALGYVPGPEEPSLAEREVIATQHYRAMPKDTRPATSNTWSTRCDLRDMAGQNFVTAVRDQDDCGSCVAFGVLAAAEGTLRIRRNDPALNIDLSEAHLFFCHGRKSGRSCGNLVNGVQEPNGGWWPGAALSAFEVDGVVDETCFKYPSDTQLSPTTATPACQPCVDWQGHVLKIADWAVLDNVDEMKRHICGGRGPLVACFQVYDDFQPFFRLNHTGIYRRNPTAIPKGGHCVCAIGYNDNDRYWICKNSWGSTWGDGGYFKIGYGEAGIDAYMWSVDIS